MKYDLFVLNRRNPAVLSSFILPSEKVNLIQLLQHEKMSIKLVVDASRFFQQ